jgi:signal transduction histidine kinase
MRLEALANLAHELRTPIQVLLGYVEILRDEWAAEMPDEPRAILERMSANVYDLGQTIDNMMEFALGDANSGTRIEEDITLDSLLGEVTPALEAANQKKRLGLQFELNDAPEIIRAPRRAIRSILLNLALNAIKFTDSGNVTIRIQRARPNAKDDAFQIEVSDTGPGVNPTLLREASKPFAQLSTSSARRHRGLGLGLSLVQRNIAALNGRLELHNGAEGGASFVVRIPGRGRELPTHYGRPKLDHAAAHHGQHAPRKPGGTSPR